MSSKIAREGRALPNRGRPFDWGRGWVPRVVVIAAMASILIFNTFALFLSVPYIVRGLPEEHGSYISGTVRMPYIPLDNSEIEVQIPDTDIVPYRPFPIVVRYGIGLIPYGVQELSFGSIANTYEMALSMDQISGQWCGRVMVPGLPRVGPWNMTMIGFDSPGGIEMYRIGIGTIEVGASAPGELDVMPALRPDRTVGDSIQLRVGGAFGDLSRSISYSIDDGSESSIPYGKGAEIHIDGLKEGWHRLSIHGPLDDVAVHPFRIPPSENATKQAPDVTIRAVFGGKDGTYYQDSTGSVRIIGESERAVSDSFYVVTMSYASDPRGNVSDAGWEFEKYLPTPAHGVNVSGRIYPATLEEGGMSFFSIVFLDSDLSNDPVLNVQAGPMVPRSICRIREFSISLVEGKTPSVELSYDPFLPETIVSPTGSLGIAISDSGYDLGRKTFDSPPSVRIGGSDVQGNESRPMGYWTEWIYKADRSAARSGTTMEIAANATFVYRDNLFLLLPIPPFLFGFETPIVGFAAVLWFFVLFAAIVASIYYLIIQELKIAKPKGTMQSRGILGPESPLYLTAQTYSGILFFSVASVIAFNLLDQSTSVPGILSESTPVHFRMLMLAEASVWEEVVSRIGYIGIPLYLLGLFRGRRGIAGGLLGGSGKVGYPEAALILVSASLFGIAHLGWGGWKVLPTFVSGLLLGYLFVKVGVHASIAVHFLIDYSSFLWEISPGAGYLEWAYGLALLVLLASGVVALGIVLQRTISKFKRRPYRSGALWIAAGIHSAGAVIFALLIGPGDPVFFAIMFFVPLAYAIWFVLKKAGLAALGRGVLMVMSIPSLVLAPLGFAFAMADADGDFGH